ncbi:hypothetical protein OG400_21495 [Micromonospora ureilytica]|uniref:hypothetical protein n=1 Tax=Micromonospora ureilytica TaxID=709868 RepID=UPI002E11CE73|nr:hypothetical protein OG400_21495 [Micromonospora ureilytica]
MTYRVRKPDVHPEAGEQVDDGLLRCGLRHQVCEEREEVMLAGLLDELREHTLAIAQAAGQA